MKQIKLRERIPSILLLFLSLTYILMAFSPSQYDMVSDLYQVVNENPFSDRFRALTLGALFTIFTILFLTILLLLALTSFFYDHLYNYHTIHKFICFFLFLEGISEILAFSFVLQTSGTEHSYYSVFNLLSLFLTLLVMVSYYVLFFLFIDSPYRKIKKEINGEKEERPVEKKPEEEKTKTSSSKAEMVKMVTTLLDEKKISKEEADRMIERIYSDKEE